MSIHKKWLAYVAIKRAGSGALFAYLPSLDIDLPEGWEWNVIQEGRGYRVTDTMDVSGVAESMKFKTLDETCRFMCQDTGISWPEPACNDCKGE